MKIRLIGVLLLSLALVGCRELTTLNRPYQRVLITDFSIPVRTLFPARPDYPETLALRVSGRISRPVVLAVDQLGSAGRVPVRRDTLAAGTHTNRLFRSDSYANNAPLELTVTGSSNTTGSLAIEWSAH